MASIDSIKNGEKGLSTRNKLNAAIAEANKVDSKVTSGEVGVEAIETSTGSQPVAGALDDRIIHVSSYNEMLGFLSVASELAVFNLNGSYFKLSDGEFVRWVNPDNENIIYVSSSGSNANTGFSSSVPKLTIQSAIDTLAMFGPYLQGQWVIQIAAGTYARGRFPDLGLESENPILIRGVDVGGHPNVPTTIISEGVTGITGNGLLALSDTEYVAQDIKFIGWNGSASSEGCSSNDDGRLFTINCHFENCTYGASGTEQSNVDVKGGIFTRCGYINDVDPFGAGVRTLFNSRHAIGVQNAGTLANGPIFTDCAKAAFAQEGSTGHCDYATIEDCVRGLEANINSRFNYSGTSFKRNGIDVLCNYSHVFASNPVYGTGIDESDSRVVINNLGTSAGLGFLEEYEESRAISEKTYDIDYVNTLINETASGTPANIFHTSTLSGGMWRNLSSGITQGRKLNFKVAGQLNGTASSKTILMRFGSSFVGIGFVAADSGAFEIEGSIYFPGREEQFMTIRGYRHLSPSMRVANTSMTQSLTADTPITLEANVGDAADSVRIYTVEASIAG